MEVEFRCGEVISASANPNVGPSQSVVICNQYVKCVGLVGGPAFPP